MQGNVVIVKPTKHVIVPVRISRITDAQSLQSHLRVVVGVVP